MTWAVRLRGNREDYDSGTAQSWPIFTWQMTVKARFYAVDCSPCASRTTLRVWVVKVASPEYQTLFLQRNSTSACAELTKGRPLTRHYSYQDWSDRFFKYKFGAFSEFPSVQPSTEDSTALLPKCQDKRAPFSSSFLASGLVRQGSSKQFIPRPRGSRS